MPAKERQQILGIAILFTLIIFGSGFYYIYIVHDKVFSPYEHSDEVLEDFGISIFEIFLKTKFFNMLFFLLRPLRNAVEFCSVHEHV